MSPRPCQPYDCPNSRVVSDTSLYDALVRDLTNQPIRTPKCHPDTLVSNILFKKLRFCIAKLRPCKTTSHQQLTTTTTTSHILYSENEREVQFRCPDYLLLTADDRLSEIDAEAIFQDVSSQTPSYQQSIDEYATDQKRGDTLRRQSIKSSDLISASSLSSPAPSAPPPPAPVSPEAAAMNAEGRTIIQGELAQEIPLHYCEFPDSKEPYILSSTGQQLPHVSTSPPLYDSGTADTTSLSSLPFSVSCNGQCVFEEAKDIEDDASYSSIHSVYSTFAASPTATNYIYAINNMSSPSPPLSPKLSTFRLPDPVISYPSLPTSTSMSSSSSSSLSLSSSTSSSSAISFKSLASTSLVQPTTLTTTEEMDHMMMPPLRKSLTPCLLSKADLSFADKLAHDFWMGKQVVCKHEKVATWLGTSDAFRASVLKAYMNHFNFTDQRLDQAFRSLCGKLYFKAEAQQLDRIIEAFANRYWECNPVDSYYSADIVYAITYALLLLNTDLHVVHERHQKMKKAIFVKNTMETVLSLLSSSSSNPSAPNEDNSATCPSSAPVPSPTTTLKSNADCRLQKSLSHHNLTLAHVSLKPFTFWRSQHHQQPHGKPKSPIKDSEAGKNMATTDNSSTLQNKKAYSLMDLSGYLNAGHPPLEHQHTKHRELWIVQLEQLLKDMYTSIRSQEIVKLTVSHDNIPVPEERQSSDKAADSRRDKGELRRKRGQSAPPASERLSFNSLASREHADGGPDGSGGNCPDFSSNGNVDHRYDDDLNSNSTLRHPQQRDQICHLPDGPDCSTTLMKPDEKESIQPHVEMEGWAIRKCLTGSHCQKAKQRKWKLCYLKVQEGKLCMRQSSRRSLPGHHLIQHFRRQHGSRSQWSRWRRLRPSSYDDTNDADDDLDDDIYNNRNYAISDKQKIDGGGREEIVDLKHSLSNVLPPPGWHGDRNHVFCLQMADGSSWLFHVSSVEKTKVWTHCLNYWAALQSRSPLQGAVTNVDYGFSTTSAEYDVLLPSVPQSYLLPYWEPPLPCMIQSQQVTVDGQLGSIQRYIQMLHCQVNHHRSLRGHVEKRFPPRSTNGIRAMANWERKMEHLLVEKVKFMVYYDTLNQHLTVTL